jgi:hypothetical protein
MLSKKRSQNLAAIVALVITAWASLATSQRSPSIDNSTLYVISDCVTPTFEQTVRSSGGVLVSGVDYTQIGFPNSTVHLGQDNNGLYNNGTTNVSRSCVQTYGDNSAGDGRFIYSCFDNGDYACSVVIILQ